MRASLSQCGRRRVLWRCAACMRSSLDATLLRLGCRGQEQVAALEMAERPQVSVLLLFLLCNKAWFGGERSYQQLNLSFPS